MGGQNWGALMIKLAKKRVLNLVTSYIPHGTTQDGTRTIVEVNKYLDLYKVPYVWGGDFNRSTDEFENQGTRQGGHYCVAPCDRSKCVGRGRIEDFSKNASREHLVGNCYIIKFLRPHCQSC